MSQSEQNSGDKTGEQAIAGKSFDATQKIRLLNVLLHQRPDQVGGSMQQRSPHSEESMQAAEQCGDDSHAHSDQDGGSNRHDGHPQRWTFESKRLASSLGPYRGKKEPGCAGPKENALWWIGSPDGDDDQRIANEKLRQQKGPSPAD